MIRVSTTNFYLSKIRHSASITLEVKIYLESQQYRKVKMRKCEKAREMNVVKWEDMVITSQAMRVGKDTKSRAMGTKKSRIKF